VRKATRKLVAEAKTPATMSAAAAV